MELAAHLAGSAGSRGHGPGRGSFRQWWRSAAHDSLLSEMETRGLDPFLRALAPAETFRDRGVAIPFTTPFLFGARLRMGEDGRTREMLVANPYGGAGVYVLPARNVPDACAPTMHDRVMLGELLGLPEVTPGAVRAVALKIAVEGHAGRAVAASARAAIQRSASCLAGLRDALGRECAWLEGRPDILARLSDVGRADRAAEARHRCLVERLRQSLAGFACAGDAVRTPHGDRAALILFQAGLVLRRAEGLLRDIDRLLVVGSRLGIDETLQELSTRLDELSWVLDGWDVVVAMCGRKPGAVVVAPFGDIVRVMPPVPRAEARLFGLDAQWEAMFRVAEGIRHVPVGAGVRRIDMIAEIEALRAEQLR